MTLKNSNPIIFTLVFYLFFNYSFSQEYTVEEQSNFWRNVQFGGGVGLNFANNFFSASIAPQAIYNFNQKVGLGLGLNAAYSSQKNRFRSTILGGSIIGLYNPIREVQLSAEFEQLNIDQNFDENFVSNVDDNFWNSALFLGLGYRTNNVVFGIRYDVLYDRDRSIYAEPWIPFVRFWF